MSRRLLVLLLFPALFIACRKDGDDPPILPPQEPAETEPAVLTKVRKPITAAFTGYYEGLPANYSKNNLKYPLIVYLHGLGQRGDGNTQLDFVGYDGLGKLLENKQLPPNFVVGGKNFSFIYICPQYWELPDGDEVKILIDSIKLKYKVDLSRIYISGLSVGGVSATEAAGKYPFQFAAIVPMAGTTHSNLPGDFVQKCKNIAESNLPIWAFHNEFDPTIPKSDTEEFIGKVNGFSPTIPARYTLFLGENGHNAWSRALNPTFKENGRNIYEWMLQYKR
ncbi:MAG: hypothetical protein H7Y31_09650 [Chitinophagaceae bacterium]|nr:hypothetical protein [Chitinophagaceae bacterium]